jgi:hypothetical protein
MLDDIDHHLASLNVRLETRIDPAPVSKPCSLHVTLEDLRPGMCKWPEQAAGDDAILFCGNPATWRNAGSASRRSYCEFHARLTFGQAPLGNVRPKETRLIESRADHPIKNADAKPAPKPPVGRYI